MDSTNRVKGQHFLLSSQAKTLSFKQIMLMTEDDVFALLCELRWGSSEEVVCPNCGCCHQAYFISSRKQWRCKHCKHTFSITSGTVFASHKLSLKIYLLAIFLFVNAVKGISALQLSRDLGVNYRTAYVLAHKLRKSLMNQENNKILSGVIDIDGTYVHSSPRKANKKEDRIDFRLKENQNPDKRCIIVAREHYSAQEKLKNKYFQGAKTTLVKVVDYENQAVVKDIALKFIAKGSKIHSDENAAYDVLIPFYDLHTVNHKKEYRSEVGITNNQAESYFSRFKRMYYGQVHKMSNKYLLNYANEVAYREDNRRTPNGFQFKDILKKCLNLSNKNNEWVGYWQNHCHV